MKHALMAACAASLCALATAAWAQDYPSPYAATSPTIPSNTGAPLYSYHRTGPQPGAVGSCEVISGNRVCSDTAGYGYGYGPADGIIGAPVAVIAAPFGFMNGTPAGSANTPASATGAPAYSYESHIPPQPGAVGYCDIVSGNHVCFP
jgi:hypothetical protein